MSICAFPAQAPSMLSMSPGSTESKVIVPVLVVDLLTLLPLTGINVTVKLPFPCVNLIFIVANMLVWFLVKI